MISRFNLSFYNSIILRMSLLVVHLGLVLIGFIQAQDLTARPDRGFGGKGGYQTSEIDAISLQNGGVTVSIPLASLPSMAGGKLGYTLSATYNSKLWDVHTKEVSAPPTQPGCATSYSTEEVWENQTGAGWLIGAGYELFFRDANDDYDYIEPDSEICYGYEYYHMAGRFFKPMLRTPDGGEHELRIVGSYPTYHALGQRDHMKGYYKQEGGLPNQPTFANPARFYTIDGSYITIDYTPNASPIKSVMYLKDGTRIESSNEGQRTIDPNGNSVLRGYNSTGGYSFAKDEHTNREIRWSATTHNGSSATKVEYQSAGGQWQETIIVWGTTTVKGKVYTRTGWNPNGGEFGQGDTCYHQEILPETSFNVIREIIFPQTEQGVSPLKYEFEYNSDTASQVTSDVILYCGIGAQPQPYNRLTSYGWGELSKVVTATGAEIDYKYSIEGIHEFSSSLFLPQETIVKNFVTEKSVTHDGETDTWLYSVDNVSPQWGSTGMVTNPNGSTYRETYSGTNSAYAGYGGTDGFGGNQIKTISSNGVVVERKWKALGGTFPSVGSPTQLTAINAVVEIEYTTLMSSDGQTRLKMSAKKFEHDYNGEVKKIIEYDWFDPSTVTYNPSGNQNGIPVDVPSGAAVLRVTETDYHNEAASAASSNAYQNRALGTNTVVLSAPKESRVGSLTTAKAKTRFSYDGYSYGTAPVNGNVTTVSTWNDVTSTWIDTLSSYSSRGNLTSATDPNGNVTQITYGSVGGYTDLYPTQTIVAHGTSVARTSTMQYDLATGFPTVATDADNNVSVATEYDILGRPIKVRNAVGTLLESWTTTEYSDSNRRVVVRSDVEMLGDGRKVAIQHYDQLGRVRLARTLENTATEDPYNEAHGIKIETRYQTGNPNSFQVTSNPFRAASSALATNEPTMGWIRSKAWNTGRRSEVETFAGATLPAPWGSNTGTTGIVVTESDADRTFVTDQAGKRRMSRTNALGQLKDVWEITGQGAETEAVSFPGYSGLHGYKTSYNYDPLNNLTVVIQGIQTRTFAYSSLSRLLSATNPESGSISYQYDPKGNLTRKADARGVQTDYIYDALNRVTNRNYSTPGGTPSNYLTTPNVVYTYDDPAVLNSKGKLTKVSSSVSTTEYVAFDILGRVTRSKQTTDGVVYGDDSNPMTYTYNLSSALIEQTYPSGRAVRNTIDSDGSLTLVQSKKNSSDFYRPYTSNIAYNAAGAVTAMKLGNGRWESITYNSRLQLTQIGLGSGVNAQNLLDLDFTYGTAQNNGNVLTQKITVKRQGQGDLVFDQTYTYDDLNRITSAEEKTGTTTNWLQAYTFDRYGNRNFNESLTTTLPKNCGTAPNYVVCSSDVAIVNPSANAANNRINGTTYDASGNVITDAEGREFTYDAENKQVEVDNGTSQLIGQYCFDGDGKRVKKVVPNGETTIFVYDAGGKLIAEYSTVVQPTQDAKTQFLTNDHLGTPRISTNGVGSVVSRSDYMPYGEETLGLGGRSSNEKYVADDVRQGFTGYELDSETDLSFAQARYFKSGFGRFSSPDDFLKDTDTSEPASWNLYIYVRNNPLKYIDPSGETIDGSRLSDEERRRLIEEFAELTGYRVEDLSFGANGLLTVASGARSSGGSATARRLLNDAINSSWEFVLVGANTTDVAFAEHAPTLKPPIRRADGTSATGGVYGQVRIDFADFNNAVFESDSAREAFSLGLTVLHEFVHGLYREGEANGLSDHLGGGAGQIENSWINPIRRELGLATRDVYSASPAGFRNAEGAMVQGVQLSFTQLQWGPLSEPTVKNRFPEEGMRPVTTHVYWQLNTVGGRRR